MRTRRCANVFRLDRDVNGDGLYEARTNGGALVAADRKVIVVSRVGIGIGSNPGATPATSPGNSFDPDIRADGGAIFFTSTAKDLQSPNGQTVPGQGRTFIYGARDVGERMDPGATSGSWATEAMYSLYNVDLQTEAWAARNIAVSPTGDAITYERVNTQGGPTKVVTEQGELGFKWGGSSNAPETWAATPRSPRSSPVPRPGAAARRTGRSTAG